MKMRTKEEMLEETEDHKEYRHLEVLLDIRNLLDLLVHPKSKLTPLFEGKFEKTDKG